MTISGLSFQDSSFTGRSFINNSGTLSLVNSTLSKNLSGGNGNIVDGTGSGGAIENSGILTVRNSNIVDNSALDPFFGGSSYEGGGLGGGIYNRGTVTVMNSTISGNSADIGGGIYNNQGTLIVMDSTISGNSAWQNGGGIETAGPLTVVNSTLANNTVGSHHFQNIGGGGIYAWYHQTGPEPLLLAFDTIYGNSSSGIGGAIVNNADTLTIEDSIIAGNTTADGSDIAGQVPPAILGGLGLVTTGGYNLFQNVAEVSFADPNGLQNTDMVINTSDLSNIFGSNPQLRNNGGTTKTYALLPGSSNPAIDKIPLSYCHIPEILNKQSDQYTDQRGVPRPNGKAQFCDIGAYEAPSTSTISTIASACQWKSIDNPNLSESFKESELHAVAAASKTDVWAVGFSVNIKSDGGGPHTFIEHWNGTVWSVVPSPDPPDEAELNGIAHVPGTNQFWTVGEYFSDTWHTLIIHWDGTRWKQVYSPDFGPQFNQLFSITAISANDVWAVGNYNIPNDYPTITTATTTLIEHWDGTRWSIIPSPNPRTSYNGKTVEDGALSSVTATSANNVWAVGSSFQLALIEHWNGQRWSIVTTPFTVGPFVSATSVPPDTLGQLVSATSVPGTDQVWVLGYGAIEHWNGISWSRVPFVPPASVLQGLTSAYAPVSIVAFSANNVWAAGEAQIEHWKGKNWTTVLAAYSLSVSPSVNNLPSVDALDAMMGVPGTQELMFVGRGDDQAFAALLDCG